LTTIKKALEELRDGKRDVDSVLKMLKDRYEDLGYAKVDLSRERRIGCPEVIYCEGKDPEHIKGIVSSMLENGSNILATRADEEVYRAISEVCEEARYNSMAKIVVIKKNEVDIPSSHIAVVTAGTSDLPVAEEAIETARLLGNEVKLFADVGVAGLHRLMDNLEDISKARVIVVVAGMDGALPSVLGGMVDKPIIAVPTSVGYGANFKGLSALLSMLNSCANGVCVVNIDNGFGAGYLASVINRT